MRDVLLISHMLTSMSVHLEAVSADRGTCRRSPGAVDPDASGDVCHIGSDGAGVGVSVFVAVRASI